MRDEIHRSPVDPSLDLEQRSDATVWPWNVILWCFLSLHCLMQTLTLSALFQLWGMMKHLSQLRRVAVVLYGCQDGYSTTSLQLGRDSVLSSRIFQQCRHLPKQGRLQLKSCLLTAAIYQRSVIELVKIAVEMLLNCIKLRKCLYAHSDLRAV